jgi:hypothetical protein
MQSKKSILVKDKLCEACREISSLKGYKGLGIPSIAKDCGLGQDRLYKLSVGKSGARGLPFEVYHRMTERFPQVEHILSQAV